MTKTQIRKLQALDRFINKFVDGLNEKMVDVPMGDYAKVSKGNVEVVYGDLHKYCQQEPPVQNKSPELDLAVLNAQAMFLGRMIRENLSKIDEPLASQFLQAVDVISERVKILERTLKK